MLSRSVSSVLRCTLPINLGFPNNVYAQFFVTPPLYRTFIDTQVLIIHSRTSEKPDFLFKRPQIFRLLVITRQLKASPKRSEVGNRGIQLGIEIIDNFPYGIFKNGKNRMLEGNLLSICYVEKKA